jgi:hypothetical protein
MIVSSGGFMMFSSNSQCSLILAMFLTLPHGSLYAQRQIKCPSNSSYKPALAYRLGWSEHTVKEPVKLIITVSMNPRYFNRSDMITLARRLNNEFCKEQRLTAVIFDNHRAAKEYTPTTEKTWPKTRLRGLYEFDRVTGKEEIFFSTQRNNPVDEVKIDLDSIQGKSY